MASTKKSEKRQREKQIKLRCTAEEFAAVTAKASASGMSNAAYARAAMLGDAGPRAQRRLPMDADKFRRVEALHAKYGTNLNQIAKNGNSGHPVDLPELRLALKQWGEIRDLMLEALGKSPPPPAAPTRPKGA
jgi:hypothetical protein